MDDLFLYPPIPAGNIKHNPTQNLSFIVNLVGEAQHNRDIFFYQRSRARGAGLKRLTGPPLITDLGLGVSNPRAWHRKGEGGNGRGP